MSHRVVNGQQFEGHKPALSWEDHISVAEEAVERSHGRGKLIEVPTGHRDDPEHQAKLQPVVDYARKAAASEGYNDYLHVHSSPHTLKQAGNPKGMVSGGTRIVVHPVTDELTLLHEVAHVVTNTDHSSHNARFAEVAANLYERHLGPEHAKTFRGILSHRPKESE